MKYFFHAVVKGRVHKDGEGEDLPSAEAAKAQAATIASEIAAGSSKPEDVSILVVDEDGKEIARIPATSAPPFP
ncbi:MAG TPA: hypothetical protein VE684_17890 [Crenalkalicoccus sp.]|nr:hypothetical protein [Crenalkalicoccus sp.]